MVYLVGIVVEVKEAGITVNVGEAKRCNVFILTDGETEWPDRVWSGHRVRVAADAQWRKRDGTYSLSFVARKIDVK